MGLYIENTACSRPQGAKLWETHRQMAILLFYIYTPLDDLPVLKQRFRAVCDTLDATGRLLISAEGVNGTVALVDATRFKEEFARLVPAARGNIEWKESKSSEHGRVEMSPFVDMKIAIVKELVGWDGIEQQTAS